MARSVLHAFVSGTRQMLTAQLFVSIAAVALAGWTLTVTNELIRERDRLRDRVIQLESEMGARGIVVPSAPAVVDEAPAQTETAYPGEVGLEETPEGPPQTDQPAADEPAPDRPTAEPADQPQTETPEPGAEPAQPPDRTFNPGQIFADLFAAPPPMRTIVLHARNDRDAAIARRLGEQLSGDGDVRVVTRTMAPRENRPSGYSYFDGRQSRAAAAWVARFNDVARQNQIAPWSAQLRGTALPAQGEYTADRLDIVLPPLSQNPVLRLDPRALQLERVEPQQEPAPIR